MFEVFCYAVAIVAVLWFVGEPAPQAAEALTSVEDDLRSLGELLAEVDDDLSSLEELMAEAEVLTARPVPAVAAVVAAPVAIARVEVPATDWQAMTSAELRKACSKRAIAWRNAHGKGKHLLKAQMVAALT